MGTPASNMACFFWVINSLKISVGDYPSKQALTPSLALTGHPPGLAKATYGRDVQFFQEDWEVPWEPKKKLGFLQWKIGEKKHTNLKRNRPKQRHFVPDNFRPTQILDWFHRNTPRSKDHPTGSNLQRHFTGWYNFPLRPSLPLFSSDHFFWQPSGG